MHDARYDDARYDARYDARHDVRHDVVGYQVRIGGWADWRNASS